MRLMAEKMAAAGLKYPASEAELAQKKSIC
jgi:hypothetical protein